MMYKASWKEEEVCSSYLPKGPWYQRYDVRTEAWWANMLLKDNIHSDLGSKYQGYASALAINKLMG